MLTALFSHDGFCNSLNHWCTNILTELKERTTSLLTWHTSVMSLRIVLLACLFTLTYTRKNRASLHEAFLHYANEKADGKNKTTGRNEQIVINFINGKLREEEKYHTWALKVKRIQLVKRHEFAGSTHVVFESKIDICPSKTQQRMAKEYHHIMKYQGNPCTPERLNATYLCSLWYVKNVRKSVISCPLIV
ncbi:hypothetical protein M514_11598 [Trichuris suis]|uniref:Uncharacterized protein n=1 Tax=Trichuris suis TaxID=68888 RepID=A0A085LRA8_9BILA|nr:hypothetical protein M513_11598 [Trichuris suis]KFD72354.1 hypothetical protein M514_11598 [Trichuris suis]